MNDNKTAPSPSSWRADFERACDQARFSDASRLFDRYAGRHEPLQVVLRAANAKLRSEPAKALRLLLDLEIAPSMLREHTERDSLLAEAYARTLEFDLADAALGRAFAGAHEVGDPDLVAAIGYRAVRRHILAEDAAGARQFLGLVRSGTSRESRVNALFAESAILQYEERVGEQARVLLELLRSLDPAEEAFTDVRAVATHTLAALTRELVLVDAIAEIDRQLSGTAWPADFSENLFQTMRAIGWAKALRGDSFNAFRHLKRASEVGHAGAWRVVAACDRAYLARSFEEHRWSRIELDEAERLAESVDWEATRGEERIGLLLLAQLFSSLDTSKASMYLAQYRALGDIRLTFLHRHDARLRAFAEYAAGTVEVALGNRKQGIGALRRAHEVFERFGYDFRAACCLAAEYEITAHRDLLPAIEEKLRNYPQSWLAVKMRSMSERPVAPLPPMQRRVFDEICQGKSTAQIATTLERSEFTISNHIKEIFKTFNVKSRSALVAEALRRGLIQSA